MGGLLQGMETQSLLLISPLPPIISKEDSFLGGLFFFFFNLFVHKLVLPTNSLLFSSFSHYLLLLPPGDTEEHPL